MSTAVAILREDVKVVYGGELSPLLRNLSNIDGDNSATTIDNTVLDKHCELAIGRFQLETGYSPNLDILAHKNVLVTGVRASLESAAGRDSSLARDWDRKFLNLLITFKKRIRGSMKSSSNLEPSTELNVLPDADPTQAAFSSTKRGPNTFREFNR